MLFIVANQKALKCRKFRRCIFCLQFLCWCNLGFHISPKYTLFWALGTPPVEPFDVHAKWTPPADMYTPISVHCCIKGLPRGVNTSGGSRYGMVGWYMQWAFKLIPGGNRHLTTLSSYGPSKSAVWQTFKPLHKWPKKGQNLLFFFWAPPSSKS